MTKIVDVNLDLDNFVSKKQYKKDINHIEKLLIFLINELANKNNLKPLTTEEIDNIYQNYFKVTK